MMSESLLRARSYEEKAQQSIREEERPAIHLSPRTGWMNDPNGFSYYQGQYHLFYQYYPYDCHWNTMHWGHAVSEDLLHWSYLPAVLAPDTPLDKDGCFSGSALTLHDQRHLLMYTGVSKKVSSSGEEEMVQIQCLALGDGKDYVKYEGNPVLGAGDVPPGGSIADFRDPKLWQEKDGSYRCIVSNRGANGYGQILLFSSEDAFHWSYYSTLIANDGRFGSMWECPDFFELDGKWVLLTGPMDMLPQGLEYHNGNGSLCLIGSYDEKEGRFLEESNTAIDYGIDFYASQTLKAPDGRRIMIAWMQNWDTCAVRGENMKWFGQMTLPRELSIRHGRLYQWPVRELEAARTNAVFYMHLLVEGKKVLPGIEGRQVDLALEIRPASGKGYRSFSVHFGENERFYTELTYRPEDETLKLDRTFSGSKRALIHQRWAAVQPQEGVLSLRLIIDRYSVEVFVNQGEKVMTLTYYTDLSAQGISFHGDGPVDLNIKKWDLR